MRNFNLHSKAAIVTGAVVATALVGGTAWAFVLASGSGTNSNAKGNPQAGNTVTVAVADSTGTLAPGGPAVTYGVTITNLGNNAVQIGNGTPTVTIAGCNVTGDAALTVSLSPPSTFVVAKNGSATATVTVSMPDSLTQNQTGCVGAQVSVTASY